MVFPAHAGMSRPAIAPMTRALSFPRSRGDEPGMDSSAGWYLPFSPLTRG